jgi:hypothetical protein
MMWLIGLGIFLLCLQFFMTLSSTTKTMLMVLGAGFVVGGVTKQNGMW